MIVRQLLLERFRNLRKVALEPSTQFNVLWGANAQGKTNLLEAVYLLGNLKSFRGARNEDLILHGESRARLQGTIHSRRVDRRLDLIIEREAKTGRIDGKEMKNAGTFLGHLKPVLFSPEEVNLVKGPPSGRRSLLDRAVFQDDPAFLGRAQEYRRYLKQRNALLREGRSEAEVAPWTEGLIRSGAAVRRDRHRFVERLSPQLKEAYRGIAGGSEEADLHYPAGREGSEDFCAHLREEMERVAERERRLGQTLAGPHRDDLVFSVQGRSLRSYGSQGQQRSYILAFKSAQVIDLETRTGEPPVLLLDDMTSELDRRRQRYFFDFIRARRGQVFITMTDPRPLLEEGFQEARFFRVTGGALEENSRT